MEIDKELLNEMPFLNITFKIEKDFTVLIKKLKMVMIGQLELWWVTEKNWCKVSKFSSLIIFRGRLSSNKVLGQKEVEIMLFQMIKVVNGIQER